MCNHFRNIPGGEQLVSTWREYIGWSLTPISGELAETSGDQWPRKPALVVCNHSDGAAVSAMRWGVPLTVPGKRVGSIATRHVTNVRNLASPFWRSMLAQREQRCLVPFTRFAEPKPNAGREEVWFEVPAEPIAAFAGIWRETADGTVFAYQTCEPNPLVAPIHPKAMPVILHREDYQGWMDGAPAQELARPYPSQLMGVAE